MPRNHLTASGSLRNRNRITNKTRLKIHIGNIDADPIIPDEDEEKNRMLQSVAGVDQEDANEHHLQAVLNEVAFRNHSSPRSTRGASAAPAAYIPIPDSTGVAEKYEEFYSTTGWNDPHAYVFSSSTVEESCRDALANGFTYYMDDRDKEWLDKSNEAARDEGTSAQGAVSSYYGIRASRSAKAKGKEPESTQPVAVNEDEFELVMGLFELITHEKFEFLHHGLENGMTFPSFTEYQEAFTQPLPASYFAACLVPESIPAGCNLVKMAKTIYPHWKERRIERNGYRIIPVLNADESDTLNESYVCFRRRDVKAVRKTRASQASSSDKLARLQLELSQPLELARTILAREVAKKEQTILSRAVWERRAALVDLKRKLPALGEKADDELLVDKERPAKKPDISRVTGVKIPPKIDPASHPSSRHDGTTVRPKDRWERLQAQTEQLLARQKEKDHSWDDFVDNAYQSTPPAPFASRLFKYISPPESRDVSDTEEDQEQAVLRQPRALRMRRGRGGRLLLDRRFGGPLSARQPRRKNPLDVDGMNTGDNNSDEESIRKLAERWRFDSDDGPAFGTQGSEEHDRVLVDDYDTKYLRHTMGLFLDSDAQFMLTDASIIKYDDKGNKQAVVPFRLGYQHPAFHRNSASMSRPFLQGQRMMIHPQPPGTSGIPSLPPNTTPISQQLKAQTNISQHMRISANGGMRPSSVPTTMPASSPPPTHVPPHSSPPTSHHSPPKVVSSGATISVPQFDLLKSDVNGTSLPNGSEAIVQQQPPDVPAQAPENMINGNYHPRPKSRAQEHPAIPLHTNGWFNPAVVNAQYLPQLNGQPSALSLQQVQNLKSVFASPNAQDAAAFQANGTRQFALQVPPGRNLQWSNAAAATQRPSSVVNGMDGSMLHSLPSPSMGHAAPVRSPSANGMLRAGHISHSMSPHIQHSPSPIPSIAQSHSPPRIPQTPMVMASPPMQHQQL